MPKVSFASKDQYEPKLGFQEGWFEISDAKVQVFQYPANKETGDQTPPFTAAVISFQKTDEQGNALEEEPQERALRMHKDPEQLRPGQATSRDDDDPSDMGTELDAEGNCAYTETGAKVNVNTTWAVFSRSLEERGIPPKILLAGYMPDLIGIKGHAVTTKGEKRNIGGRDVEPAYLVVDKVTYNPFDATAKKPAGKSASSSSKVNGAAKPNGAPAKAAASDANGAEELATSILTEIAADLSGETRDNKKLYALAYSRLVKDKHRDKAHDKAVQELLRDEDWLTAKGSELELWTYDGGVFTFGEAAA